MSFHATRQQRSIKLGTRLLTTLGAGLILALGGTGLHSYAQMQVPDSAERAVQRVHLPASLLKGQPAEYATCHQRDGDGEVTVTFVGGVVTAFAIWPPDGL